MYLVQSTHSQTPHLISPEERRLHLYHRGDRIILNNQGLWQVYRGYVQLSTTQISGEEIMLGWAQPNSFFGQALSRLQVCEARALCDVYLRWFFLPEIEQSPHLAQLVLKQLIQRLRQSEALLTIAGQRRVEERLYYFLKLLKDELGEATPEGVTLPIRLTHQNFANALGTTRVTITRLMGKLQKEGQIGFNRDRHLVIHQPEFFDNTLF
ncbi:Crp/Fnr family transcriptional regulator [Spirulina subsalsa FACHB-351]|uniref:Crp/Fnr family transcriptional regulator n=1 Tax=Spirulina subsalsa FACHB-351 TaxID=234711 RepID=A0ABT3L1Q5_9CYAN|nr:Crp/Fnr family transcriptional regulator [Spirulina subsalsa]MCW6035416.1 Crp/Fnr family transcriptional regulator [Spirulina subsalsa FACHB-351]